MDKFAIGFLGCDEVRLLMYGQIAMLLCEQIWRARLVAWVLTICVASLLTILVVRFLW